MSALQSWRRMPPNEIMNCREANLELQPLRDEFSLRLYRWSVKDAFRELKEGFPLLGSVRDSSACLFLDFIEDMKPTAAKALMRGRVKRHMPEAMALAGEVITEEEQLLSEEFTDYHLKPFLTGGEELKEARISPRELELRKKYFSSRPDRARIRRSLREEIGNQLESVLGLPQRTTDSSGLSYIQEVGGWYLYTGFDLGGKADLSYAHQVRARRNRDSCNTNLSKGISVLGWLGVLSLSSWHLIMEEDVPQVAESLRTICTHFVESLPRLVAGLDNPIPQRSMGE